MTTHKPFHQKYRPATLDRCLGHDAVVTRLKGIVKSDKIPSAIMFSGPSSAGKTTLARALAADINGLATVDGSRDYLEHNCTAEGSIDDMRSMLKTSHFRPSGKRRVIVLDECQGILRLPASSALILKSVEEPSPQTLFILCTMDPSKFATDKNGKALMNRCVQFNLEAHTDADLYKQAVRIAKGEGMSYVISEDKSVLKAVVKSCNAEMRTLANIMESLQQYAEGLDKKPKLLTAEDVSSVIDTIESSDEKLVADILFNVYARQFGKVQRAILDINDGFTFVNSLLRANEYILNSFVLNGARHRKVWPSKVSKDITEMMNKAKLNPSLGAIALVNERLVEIKSLTMTFATSTESLLSAKLFRLIKELPAPEAK